VNPCEMISLADAASSPKCCLSDACTFGCARAWDRPVADKQGRPATFREYPDPLPLPSAESRSRSGIFSESRWASLFISYWRSHARAHPMYTRPTGSTSGELAASAREIISQGFTAMKFLPFGKVHLVDHYSVVEDAATRVGSGARGGRIWGRYPARLPRPGLTGDGCLAGGSYAALSSLFIEEPVLPENIDALARVAKQFKTPLATGERLFTKWAFRDVLEKGAASILQPDPCICGGILESTHIAAMAECHYCRGSSAQSIRPHQSGGGPSNRRLHS